MKRIILSIVLTLAVVYVINNGLNVNVGDDTKKIHFKMNIEPVDFSAKYQSIKNKMPWKK